MNKDKLFQILVDPSASDAEKDDAVIELGENFQDDETVEFLVNVSNESNCNEMIAGSCGESIGQIWLAIQQINYEKLSQLKGIAFNEAISLIKAKCSEWYRTYLDLFPHS
ncbi:hypothetical protein C173_03514 [Paenibacillus sp. FSL R7-277]|uniref:hypothetical protein n=1 Tax=Paenibacillus sp. FSL R7-277 TaxID=1227352 RepID=UPI0003E21B46|nr:hypothetical protein [Paenibacillus sp. FSL R7-277]ETT77552.1 hypothetical protein C173_03514 [Paenibacillus sp. FSL R7-277]